MSVWTALPSYMALRGDLMAMKVKFSYRNRKFIVVHSLCFFLFKLKSMGFHGVTLLKHRGTEKLLWVFHCKCINHDCRRRRRSLSNANHCTISIISFISSRVLFWHPTNHPTPHRNPLCLEYHLAPPLLAVHCRIGCCRWLVR